MGEMRGFFSHCKSCFFNIYHLTISQVITYLCYSLFSPFVLTQSHISQYQGDQRQSLRDLLCRCPTKQDFAHQHLSVARSACTAPGVVLCIGGHCCSTAPARTLWHLHPKARAVDAQLSAPPIWLTHPRNELKTRRRTFRLVDRKGRLNLWEGEGRFPVNDIMCGFKVKQVLCWIRASALGAGTNQNNISCHPRIKADKCLLCCSASRQPGSLWKRCNSPWMQHLTLNAPFLCVSQPLICHGAPNFKQIWMCSECLMGRLHGGGKIPSGSSGMERQMAESWDQSLKTTWLCWNKCFTTEAATP